MEPRENVCVQVRASTPHPSPLPSEGRGDRPASCVAAEHAKVPGFNAGIGSGNSLHEPLDGNIDNPQVANIMEPREKVCPRTCGHPHPSPLPSEGRGDRPPSCVAAE